MIITEMKEEITPICPYCSFSLQKVWFKELKSVFGRRYIYFCPNCKKVLGISHRKGFFMG
jgi:uncharacterized protein with PIN domain